MAIFQKTTPRQDNVSKHKLTENEIKFLVELQKELNTQDTMCQADPRFWVIAGTKDYLTAEDQADDEIIVDTDTSETMATSLTEAIEWFVSLYETQGIDTSEWQNLSEVIEALHDVGLTQYEVRYIEHRKHIYQDTLFLTHKDAEDHLRKFGYNYDPTAHAFAMTAHRSPSVEKLLQILQQTDWNNL